MSFCSFTKDFSKNSITGINNSFITDYLTDASGDAVKVYIYGLYLCENSAVDQSLEKFASELYMDEDAVRDCFKFWEEYGIVSVISEDPFTVKYLPLSATAKPRKYNTEKYTEFNKAIQTHITERMITPNEFSAYFSFMEENNIKPEAMLMLVKYCVDLKGANIGFRYILTVCRDFASRGITTTDQIEEELSDYINRTAEIQRVLTALGVKRKPEIEDLKLFNKWRYEMQFELDSIIFASKKIKARNMEKLDAFMHELFNNKCFGQKEIEGYLLEKTEIRETTVEVARALGVYCEVLETYIDNYISPWRNKGFDRDALAYIARFCFKKKRKSFEEMDEMVKNMYDIGCISFESLVNYFNGIINEDNFVKTLLASAECERRPNKWDREQLQKWREWGFSDEMLVEAALLSVGKSAPLRYMNVILGNWKNQGIFKKQDIPAKPAVDSNNSKTQAIAPVFGNEHTYSKEDFDAIFDNIEDIDI